MAICCCIRSQITNKINEIKNKRTRMNFNTYGTYYGKFHKCNISIVRNDIMIFELGDSPYETWMVSRMCPPEKITIDSNKPFLLALKSFFKSDVPASVICNDKYLWTVCLGKERVIYPVSKDVKPETTLHLYATPYFVTHPHTVHQYLQGTIRPAYENVYFHQNTILYLDNGDLPFPGGCYFDEGEPTSFYRICFLSNEPIENVVALASEWQSRRDVLTIPYMTRDVTTVPKFIDFKPIPDFNFSESNVVSTGNIQRNLSSKKPEHLIQDVLISYYKNVSRHMSEHSNFNLTYVGLILEWPIQLTFEGSRPSQTQTSDRKFVALSINGNLPNRVVYVLHPYERYMEYNHVPATVWTPVSFAFSTLVTDVAIQKVVLDTVVIGLVYREMFFCLGQPLLEGRPATPGRATSNGKYLLSVAEDIEKDPNIQVIETFKRDENHSLRRVSLKGIPLEAWCLTKAENTHPHPKNIQLPYLVKEWLRFFTEVGPNPYGDVDVGLVRLALTLSKHSICYNLIATEQPREPVDLSDRQVKFFMHEKVVNFINEARIVKSSQEDKGCIIT